MANTFNAITVDGDQSTNDMVSIFSTRAIKLGPNLSLNDKVVQKFEFALKNLGLNLAQQIVVDGERIGGYYDLVEHLINKEVINYAGKPKWKNNN